MRLKFILHFIGRKSIVMTVKSYQDLLESVNQRAMKDTIALNKIETLFEMVDMHTEMAKYDADVVVYTEHGDNIDREFMYTEADNTASATRKNIFQKAWDFIVGLFKTIKENIAKIFSSKKDVKPSEKLVVPERYGADKSIISTVKSVAASIPSTIKNRAGLIVAGLGLITASGALKMKIDSKKGDASKVMTAEQVENDIIAPVNEVLDKFEQGVESMKNASEELDPNQTSDAADDTSASKPDDNKSSEKKDDSKEGIFSGKSNSSIIGTITSKLSYIITKVRGIVDYVAGLFLKATGREAKGYEGKTVDNENIGKEESKETSEEKSEDNK